MNPDSWLPPLLLASSLVPGLVIFMLREEQRGLRTLLNLAGAFIKLGLVVFMLWGVYHGHTYETTISFLPGLDLTFRAAPLPMLFITLSALLWLVTTVYAIGYLEGSPNRSRFFGFFSLCVSSTVGIALAGDLLTLLVFYEMLTLTTYPLVVHRGTEQSIRAGRAYLAYTLTGSVVLLFAIAWLYALTGDLCFQEAGRLSGLPEQDAPALRVIFTMLILGFGVKAALVPLHGWLPQAMVAPAPVSALLHAVAVVKAGAFGIVRIVSDVYGIEFANELGVLTPLAVAASVTIIYGSLRALAQDDLKKRLAFSTVSQVSYIALGVSLGTPLATIGGIVHLVHQGLMKITLFFCAGNFAERIHIHRISEMDGVGRKMPWTMATFTIGAFGMIGVPPLAGFVTKWYLATGALEAGQPWVIGVLAASSLLNAGYFLPILYRGWFRPADDTVQNEDSSGSEIAWALLAPPMITASLALVAGLFAASGFSPLAWAEVITAREFGS